MRLIASLLLALAAAGRPDPAAEVRAAESAFAGAFAARDPSKFFSMVAEDAVFLSPSETLAGKPEVVKGWSRFFQGAAPPFSWRPERVAVSGNGDVGLSLGPVFDPAGRQVGNFSSVWRRQSDGSWKVVFDGPGSPVCPAISAALPAPSAALPAPSAALPAPSPALPAAAAGPQATCMFTHPAFAGKCTERPALAKGQSARQACEAILKCLNDVRCIQTYCQTTSQRTNWKLESAK